MTENPEVGTSNIPLVAILIVFMILVILLFVFPWTEYAQYVDEAYIVVQLLAVATYIVSGIVVFSREVSREEYSPQSPITLINVGDFGPLASIVGELSQVTFLIHTSYLLIVGIGLNEWNHGLRTRSYIIVLGIAFVLLLIAVGSVWTRVEFLRREWPWRSVDLRW